MLTAPGNRRSAEEKSWGRLPTEELLDFRLKDLGLKLEGTTLADRVRRLHAELDEAGVRFKPYVWLSTDWFTPDGTTGFAAPFFLAHTRLVRLEHKQMFEVEGGTSNWCMKLLRHEAAHALDNAYRLRRRKRWREVFGSPTTPYRATYRPNPASRRYVQHLNYWYSQSHPIEDFAETFAVWLGQPSWREDYAAWPALTKLQYVDDLMHELGDQAPRVRTRAHIDPLRSEQGTLRDYYRKKQARYSLHLPGTFDDHLRSVFPSAARGRESAASFLRRRRADIRRRVAHVTGRETYLVDQVLDEILPRCRILGLARPQLEQRAFVDACILVTTLAVSFVKGQRPRYAR